MSIKDDNDNNVFIAYSDFVGSLSDHAFWPDEIPVAVMHAALGIVSEAGEFADAVKKAFAYHKPLDYTNLDEECGDLLWYIQRYLNYRNMTLEDAIQKNVKKLGLRYPDNVWTQAKAFNRDLAAERGALEE